MKEKNCKIVQDLLPNYIEKLTNKETNAFIEDHVKECTECKNVLENMQKEINVEASKNDGRKVKYIKKYSKKLKILKTILLIIFALFIIRTGRNFIIISQLASKSEEYVHSQNFARKSTSYSGDYITIMNSYYKDGKWKVESEHIIFGKDARKMTIYADDEKANFYYDTNGEKLARLNQESMMKPEMSQYFSKNENILQKLLGSITASIKSVKCNGKDCYLVNNYFSGDFLYRDNAGLYLDKETGLIVRNTEMTDINDDTGKVTDTVVDFRYEFNKVTDEDFKEPDISEYKVE